MNKLVGDEAFMVDAHIKLSWVSEHVCIEESQNMVTHG